MGLRYWKRQSPVKMDKRNSDIETNDGKSDQERSDRRWTDDIFKIAGKHGGFGKPG